MNGIEINNLTVDFGTFKLDDISVNFRKGCITGLVGKNGAGKTTLIKTIMRQQTADRGSILYNGKKFAENEVEILNSIACVFDTPHFNINLKPKRLFRLFSNMYEKFDAELYRQLMCKFRLPDNLKIRNFSYGMQKKYCLVIALCQHADILILDEPTSGIDPFDRNEVVGLIQEYLMKEDHTVLFSTHITEDLDKIADYIVMMDDGKITLDEEKDVLTEEFRLVQCGEMTEEMKACAIGVQKNMFGYVFLTRNKNISGEGVQVKVPTVEEIFVHTLGKASSFNSSVFDL